MAQRADWVLPHGSFLAEAGREQEGGEMVGVGGVGVKRSCSGCFALRSNEGIKNRLGLTSCLPICL